MGNKKGKHRGREPAANQTRTQPATTATKQGRPKPAAELAPARIHKIVGNQRGTACLTINLTALSDLHAGSGLGGAGIDALVVRDHHGHPVVRWSHVKGLLAEACRNYYADLGDGTTGKDLVARLFGSEDPRGAKRGLVYGTHLRAASNLSGRLWSSTGMEPDERSPREDTLRRIEFIEAGAGFTGEIRLPYGRDDVLQVEKLLNRLDRIGGDRSRGAGLVHLTVQKVNKEQKPLSLEPAQTPARFKVLLKARHPLCLAATGSPGNLIPTHSHLSPTTARGLLARWALDSGYDALADALIDDLISVGAAYPVPEQCTNVAVAQLDAVPIPLARQSEKPAGQDSTVPWWAQPAAAPVPADILTARSDAKLKRPGAHEYLVTQDGGTSWRVFGCPIMQAMHNDAGRSQKNKTKQALYSVEEVAEGTGFVLELDGDATTAPMVRAMLDRLKTDELWLRAGRGGAPMQVMDWAACPAPPGADASGQSDGAATAAPSGIRVFVETDLILRAADFSFHTRLDRSGVHALLADAGVDTHALAQFSCDSKESVSEVCVVHGWNSASGRPRFEAVAVRRGSEAVIHCEDPTLLKAARCALMQRCRSGFGERRQEGYGRLRIDFQPKLVPGEKPDEPPFPRNEVEALLARVQAKIQESGFPGAFLPARWQGLSNAAGNPRAREAWFVAALRVRNLSAAQRNWLTTLQSAANASHGNWSAEALAALGRVAAKRERAMPPSSTQEAT